MSRTFSRRRSLHNHRRNRLHIPHHIRRHPQTGGRKPARLHRQQRVVAQDPPGDLRPALPVDTIVANDYAFKFPPTLAPGRHRFVFINAGKQRHEINIARIKSGATYRQIAELDAKDGDIEPLLDEDHGVLHALGGATPAGTLDIDLVAGREYLLECGFSDTDTSPPHYKLGMSGSIKVRRAK